MGATDRLGQLTPLQQGMKLANVALIPNPVFTQLNPRKLAHRLGVVQRLFHTRIRQVIELLHAIDPQLCR